MVLGDGHEQERKASLRLASRGGGSQFCFPPFLGVHDLRAWQGRRAEPRTSAGPREVSNGDLGRAPVVLTTLAGTAGAIDSL